MFVFCCIAFFCLQGTAIPAFAENEVYAIQVGTVYYEATSAGVKASDNVVDKTTITHLFADAYVVQVGREGERFIGCTSLQVVDLSGASSLKIIYSETFRNCTSLHTVILPSGVSEIQSGAFRGCTSLTSIDLSATSITTITNHMFNGCTSLQAVLFPSGLTSIQYYAFYNCQSLVLGTALQSTALATIGNHAFYGCTSIVSVALPSTVTATGSFAYATVDAGTSKQITASDLVLGGTDAANYRLSTTTISETGAEITQASVTVPLPTASDIEKGDTLDDSTLTAGDGTDVPGHWEWVDGDTAPDETGAYPAIFIPDDDNYAPYGPVDVLVVVNDIGTPTIAPFSLFGDDDTSVDDVDDTSDQDSIDTSNWFTKMWNNLRNSQQGNTESQDGDGADGAVHWALANLLLCLATMVGSVLLWVRYYRLYKANSKNSVQQKIAQAATFARWEHTNGRRYNIELWICVGSLVSVLAAVLCFVLTQNMMANMCFVDWWTLLMLLLVAMEAALVVYVVVQHKGRYTDTHVQKHADHAKKTC